MNDIVETPEEETKGIFEEIKSGLIQEVRDEFQKEFKKIKIPAVAKEDDGSMGDWLAQVGLTTCTDNRREKAFNTLANKYQAKALTQGTNATAGFLVPEIWSNDLISIENYEAVLYNRVKKYDMPTDQLYIPVRDYSVTPSGGSSAFNAGVSVAVVSEGSAPGSETKPNFKQLSLTAVKVLAFTDVTNELIQNSPQNLEMIVKESFQQTALDWIEYQMLNGTSLTAIIGHASTINVPRTTANTVVALADWAKMVRRLTPRSMKRAIFVVHPYIYGELLQMKDANNNAIWLPNFHNSSDAPNLAVFGIPVYQSEFSPALGSEGDVCLVDVTQGYALGMNKDITVEASRDFKFTSDIVTYRMAMRLHGKPTLTAPIKLADTTSTVSPLITLDDATS